MRGGRNSDEEFSLEFSWFSANDRKQEKTKPRSPLVQSSVIEFEERIKFREKEGEREFRESELSSAEGERDLVTIYLKLAQTELGNLGAWEAKAMVTKS